MRWGARVEINLTNRDTFPRTFEMFRLKDNRDERTGFNDDDDGTRVVNEGEDEDHQCSEECGFCSEEESKCKKSMSDVTKCSNAVV